MDTVSNKPTLYLTAKDLPEIKSWKVGQTYEVIVQMKMASQHEMAGSPMSGSFDVISVDYPGGEEPDMDDVVSMPKNSDFSKGAAKLHRKMVEGY